MRNIYDLGATINLSANPTNTKLLLLHVWVLRRYTDSIIGNTWAPFEKKVQPNDWSIKINVASERRPMFLRLLRRVKPCYKPENSKLLDLVGFMTR